jgi:hypothetical protein
MKDVGAVCKLTLDGTDCPINEPVPFNPKYYSHKFKGPGVKYEIGICIQTGWICWWNGPFPCGNPDLSIARVGICRYLEKEEKIVADGGYRDGGVKFVTPTGLHNISDRMRSLARARHETVNGRIKKFQIFSTKYRHQLHRHRDCFQAVVNVTQVGIMIYNTNFGVYYNDEVDELDVAV